MGLPRWHSGKESANAGHSRDMVLIPGLSRSPGVGNGNPLQNSCLEDSIPRSLEGYSPWCHKELDTTEHSTHKHNKYINKSLIWGKGSQ